MTLIDSEDVLKIIDDFKESEDFFDLHLRGCILFNDESNVYCRKYKDKVILTLKKKIKQLTNKQSGVNATNQSQQNNYNSSITADKQGTKPSEIKTFDRSKTNNIVEEGQNPVSNIHMPLTSQEVEIPNVNPCIRTVGVGKNKDITQGQPNIPVCKCGHEERYHKEECLYFSQRIGGNYYACKCNKFEPKEVK